SRALQIASNVDNRIALTLPFLSTEIFAIVIPTRSASSVTDIFRFANMTSMLMMIAILLDGEIVLGFDIDRRLQDAFKHRGGRGDDGRNEDNENAHRDSAG